MIENHRNKVFDLEERTFQYARRMRTFLETLKNGETNAEDKKQLTRSSGSVAANYIEANEAISPRDFSLRIKICKKEAKESYLWLRLINPMGAQTEKERNALIQETIELGKIFGAILKKFQ
jgi:four helix bundle protein